MNKFDKVLLERGWIRDEQIAADKAGNQSHAFLARRVTDPEDGFGYILKKLRRQNVADRRAMFCAEIRAMGLLDHPGVLPVEDTNAEDYESSEDLYLITRRVMGHDLEDFVAQGLVFEEALQLTIGVLDIIKHCHSRGIVHRDIKPCHVFADAGEYESPVLIDFGLAYIDDNQPSGATTVIGQRKGNRFLVGPEHSPGTSLTTRNDTTDICQCVGLLFYALTGDEPGILLDEIGQKPHERARAKLDSGIDKWKRETLEQIFDKGFEWHPDRRWASADVLLEQVRHLLNASVSPDERLKLETEELVRQSQIQAKLDVHNQGKDMSKKLLDLVERILVPIAEGSASILKVDTTDRALDFSFPADNEGMAQKTISFRHRHGQAGGLSLSVRTAIEDSCFVVTLQPYTGASIIFPNDQPVELGRWQIGDRGFLDQARSPLQQNLLAAIDELLRKG
ncbi:protein kinase domain-containing protein [Aporhodopirellula aestuarii]|uniref:Protein kinase n=1 Tax=Aporhodopirellula aestuarii TaxID=2950107 RepID=A0ABT0U7I0_9BACT|nr:protein kinase [Aporhodopirellula aestuarii]MCM2372311.1 protein kinase [Aporhodopirellula aestuarii]